MRASHPWALRGAIVLGVLTGAIIVIRTVADADNDPLHDALFDAGLALLVAFAWLGIHFAGGQRIIDFLAHPDCPSRSRPPYACPPGDRDHATARRARASDSPARNPPPGASWPPVGGAPGPRPMLGIAPHSRAGRAQARPGNPRFVGTQRPAPGKQPPYPVSTD